MKATNQATKMYLRRSNIHQTAYSISTVNRPTLKNPQRPLRDGLPGLNHEPTLNRQFRKIIILPIKLNAKSSEERLLKLFMFQKSLVYRSPWKSSYFNSCLFRGQV